MNIWGALAKNIGVAGLGYHPTVYVNSTSKEVDLTNRILEVTFNYEGNNTRNLPIFGYEGHFYRNVTFSIYFRLADELNNGECSRFQFEIQLLKPGSYWVEWFEIVDGKRMEGSGMRIQIIEPYEWENIIKQANLIEAENKSAEASENAANTTKWLARGTFALVFATFALGFITYFVTSKSIKESRIVKIKELHTYEIRKFAESWMRNLTEIKIGTPDTPVTSPPQPQKYDFEENRLFLDIKNHTPPDLDIIGTWKKFKKLLHEYDKKRYELFKDICNMSVERTGLEYDPNLSLKTNGISEFFVRSIYDQLVTWVQKQEMKYDSYTYFPKSKWGGIVVRLEEIGGSYLFKVSNHELAKKTWGIYEEMMKMNDFDQCSEKIKEILVIEKDLKQYFQDLNSMLNDFSSIPILPGTCKFIKWSVE
ncbi:MAG: hypothetical protein KAT65_13965 [Methanophagales archaeon]|nr:hypothetical protein [Methanophagales archaeon]